MTIRVEVKLPHPTGTGFFDDAAHAGADAGAQLLLSRSNERVPYDQGPLEESGFVDVDGPNASISYDTPYAVPQHEHTEWAHPGGRVAKYLAVTMSTDADDALKAVGSAAKDALGG